ncbi:hypothetical protein ACTFIU_009366 [Dictyostelium citrinum]
MQSILKNVGLSTTIKSCSRNLIINNKNNYNLIINNNNNNCINSNLTIKRTFFSKLFGSKKDDENSNRESSKKKKTTTLGSAIKGGKVEKLQNGFTWSSLKNNDDIKTAIYSIGVNNQGQLGLGDWKSESTLVFNEQFIEYSVKSLKSTFLHSCAFTNDNDMLTWGANFNLQIGHKYGSNTSIFPNFVESSPYSVKVTNFSKSDVIGGSIGGWSSFAITKDQTTKQNSIYSWGNNQHGQLGIGTLLNIQTPNKVLLRDDSNENNNNNNNNNSNNENKCNSNNIKKISNGLYHTLFLFNNGKILSCGKSDDGQLGISFKKTNNNNNNDNNNNNNNTTTPDIKLPVPSNLLDKFKMIDIEAGYFHSIGLNENGEIYQWGKGKLRYSDGNDLQLSPFLQKNDYTSNDQQLNIIYKIIGIPNDEKVIQIGAADNLSMALTDKGKLYKWSSINDDDNKNNSEHNITAELVQYPEFNNERINKFSLSNTHAAVAFNETPNEICVWSLRDDFTLEKKFSKSMFATILPISEHNNNNIKRFTLPVDHKVTDISIGTHFLILLANYCK